MLCCRSIVHLLINETLLSVANVFFYKPKYHTDTTQISSVMTHMMSYKGKFQWFHFTVCVCVCVCVDITGPMNGQIS